VTISAPDAAIGAHHLVRRELALPSNSREPKERPQTIGVAMGVYETVRVKQAETGRLARPCELDKQPFSRIFSVSFVATPSAEANSASVYAHRTACVRKRERSAFTLIELLVVMRSSHLASLIAPGLKRRASWPAAEVRQQPAQHYSPSSSTA